MTSQGIIDICGLVAFIAFIGFALWTVFRHEKAARNDGPPFLLSAVSTAAVFIALGDEDGAREVLGPRADMDMSRACIWAEQMKERWASVDYRRQADGLPPRPITYIYEQERKKLGR